MESVSRYWRTQSERYRLEGCTCSVCGQVIFPDGPCRNCYGGRDMSLRISMEEFSSIAESSLVFPGLELEVENRV